jgi:hypothetical protein
LVFLFSRADGVSCLQLAAHHGNLDIIGIILGAGGQVPASIEWFFFFSFFFFSFYIYSFLVAFILFKLFAYRMFLF